MSSQFLKYLVDMYTAGTESSLVAFRTLKTSFRCVLLPKRQKASLLGKTPDYSGFVGRVGNTGTVDADERRCAV